VAIIGEAELIFFHHLKLYGAEALSNLLLSYYLYYNFDMESEPSCEPPLEKYNISQHRPD
jgi:hypothetical protein